jgi:putative tryptophan/tyrosine transport system permease protein
MSGYGIITFTDNVALEALLSFPLLTSLLISYRCLKIPDVTIDGSSVAGAAVCALMIQHEFSMLLAVTAGILVGFTAGIVTGLLVEVFRIDALLASILNAFVFFSLTVLLIDASISYPRQGTIFSAVQEADLRLTLPSTLIVHPYTLALLVVTAAALATLCDRFLRTEWGRVIAVAGTNDRVLTLSGVSPARVRVLGLGIANALAAFGAILLSQYEGSVQALRGPGTILFALSVSIIGWEAQRYVRRKNLPISDSAALILGGLIYFAVVGLCYASSLPVALPKLMIAFYIVGVIAQKSRAWRRFRELAS